TAWQPVTLDDHSKVVPHLPIPNRTVKRLCADDSGRTSVKVGHRQALIAQNPRKHPLRGFCFMGRHRIGDGCTGTMLIVWPLGYDFRRTTPLPKARSGHRLSLLVADYASWPKPRGLVIAYASWA